MLKEGRKPKDAAANSVLSLLLIANPLSIGEGSGGEEVDYENLSSKEKLLLSNNFEDWQYELGFGFNYDIIEFVKYEYQIESDEDAITALIENKDDVLDDLVVYSKKFEKELIIYIKNVLGQAFDYPFNQLYAAEGESLFREIEQKASNKINMISSKFIKTKNADAVKSELITEPIIVTFPFTINPELNNVFTNKSIARLLSTDWNNISVKKLMFYVLNVVMQSGNAGQIANQISSDIVDKSDVQRINIDAMDWKLVDDIAFKVDELTKNYFYSTRYAMEISILNNMGESPTGSFYVKSEV